jgi:hypothetical protein
LDRRLGGPQSRSGRGGEEKNSQPPPGIEVLHDFAYYIMVTSTSYTLLSLLVITFEPRDKIFMEHECYVIRGFLIFISVITYHDEPE